MLFVTSLPKNRLLRFALQTLAAVLLFGLGVDVGTKVVLERAKIWPEAYAAADAEFFRTYLIAESRGGSAAQHEEALRAYLAMLKRQRAHPTVITGDPGAVHEMFAYAELAELAEARGDASTAASYLVLAERLCRDGIRWRNCSRDDIAGMRRRLEDLKQKSVC